MKIIKKKKLSIKKIILIILTIFVALLVLISLFAGNYLVNYSIGRSGDGGNRTVALEIPETADDTERTIAEGKIAQQEANETFLAENPGQTVEITSEDDIHCSGIYYPNVNSHDWVIALHGYRGDHLGATSLAQHYHNHNYQVLTPDLRACGDTDGNYLGMGWLDRKDILSWIDWIIAQDSDAKIVIHGISMGAATTMMTAGEDTPDQVVAFVEDCGYTSVWDEFSYELKGQFGLPPFPLMYTTSWLCNAKYGWNFKEASSLNQVRKCKLPMFFIHGDADTYVPTWMVYPLYEAKSEPKELWLAPGATHAMSYKDHPEEYTERVKNFVGKYIY